jgi:hypothetical protein
MRIRIQNCNPEFLEVTDNVDGIGFTHYKAIHRRQADELFCGYNYDDLKKMGDGEHRIPDEIPKGTSVGIFQDPSRIKKRQYLVTEKVGDEFVGRWRCSDCNAVGSTDEMFESEDEAMAANEAELKAHPCRKTS